MNEIIHGFTKKRSRSLPEIGAVLHEYEHVHTGAKLAWLERPEENKTFGIAFETLPEDDTGVFHILEHSVLCGSDRYPVKEPFVELLKNSMNTFLNAMTFPDKTFYPVSSRSEPELINMMRVYLDAVFHPAIYHKPEIFGQEGWHYEIAPEGINYKGVVFNEMKGALADPDEQLDARMGRALFPESCYRFVSGGDPSAIPDLTYEKFLATHRRFYSPTNSYIFLDGTLDLEKILAVIDEEYLRDAPRGQRIAPPAFQGPIAGGSEEVEYELAQGEDPERRWRIAYGELAGRFDDKLRLTALLVLSDVLASNNQSVLTKAILAEGLAESVSLRLQDGIAQPWLELDVKNCREKDLGRIREVIRDTLSGLAEKGIDRRKLEAAMASLEFQLRERDYGTAPAGLVYGIYALQNWIYGGDPANDLLVGDTFEQLRARLGAGYFEALLKELLQGAPGIREIVMRPSRDCGDKKRQKEAERIRAEEQSWSPEQKRQLEAFQTGLQAWQAGKDSPEALATLPRLSLRDVPAEPEELPIRIASEGGLTVLEHDLAASGISYLNLYFDLAGFSEEELSELSFLGSLLGSLDTEHYTAEGLQDEIKIRLGSLDISAAAYSGTQRAAAKLCVSFSALDRNLEAAAGLALEIINTTKLADERQIREILRQNKIQAYQQIVNSGHAVALNRIMAQTSADGVVGECTGGLAYYQWLKAQDDDWQPERLTARLAALVPQIFRRGNLTLSATGRLSDEHWRVYRSIYQGLPEGQMPEKRPALQPWGFRKEGIAIPADVSFAALGGSLAGAGAQFSVAGLLASRIISLAQLWNEVRVSGGAYGTGMTCRDNGFLGAYSYRDPSASGSLAAYRRSAEFLRGFLAKDPDLTGFIIGTVSDGSPLLSPRLRGRAADAGYWKGLGYAERLKRRRELLALRPEQLKGVVDSFEKTLAAGGVCVIGSAVQLDKCPELTSRIAL